MTNTIVKTACLEQCDWDLVESEGRRLGLGRSASLRRIIREWAAMVRAGAQVVAEWARPTAGREG